MLVESKNYIYAAKRQKSQISKNLNIDLFRNQNEIILEIFKNLYTVFHLTKNPLLLLIGDNEIISHNRIEILLPRVKVGV